MACKKGHLNIVKLLFKELYNNDNINDGFTDNAIDFASANGHINILEWFFKHSREYLVNVQKDPKYIIEFKYSQWALFQASLYSQIDVLEWFLDKYKKFNLKLKYPKDIIEHNEVRYNHQIRNWWQYSGLLD